MKTALITGVAGFVGSTLAERLLQDGATRVIGIDTFTDYYSRSIKESNLSTAKELGLEFIESDLDSADLAALLDSVEVVYHQAGQPGVRPSWGGSFDAYVRDNISVTQKMLEAASRSASLEAFVFASSSSVYGEAERYPTRTTDRPLPRSPYGVTKLAAENLCSLYAANFGVPTVSLRYFTVYGPRQRPDMAFTRFIMRCLSGTPIELFGDGSAIRDFTFIDDIVEANVLAGSTRVEPGSIFNVAGGTSTRLSDALTMIQNLCGGQAEIRYSAATHGDVARTGGDSSATREILGWSPQVPLQDGLERHVEWVRTHSALLGSAL